MGGADERPSAKRLLPQRPARRDGGRSARSLRDLLRDFGRSGIRVRQFRGSLGSDRARSATGDVRGGPDVVVIQVALPAHLRTLARVQGDVEIAVDAPVTLDAVLDALESKYPVLRGTIRDHASRRRRPFIRFFACEIVQSMLIRTWLVHTAIAPQVPTSRNSAGTCSSLVYTSIPRTYSRGGMFCCVARTPLRNHVGAQPSFR